MQHTYLRFSFDLHSIFRISFGGVTVSADGQVAGSCECGIIKCGLGPSLVELRAVRDALCCLQTTHEFENAALALALEPNRGTQPATHLSRTATANVRTVPRFVATDCCDAMSHLMNRHVERSVDTSFWPSPSQLRKLHPVSGKLIGNWVTDRETDR